MLEILRQLLSSVAKLFFGLLAKSRNEPEPIAPAPPPPLTSPIVTPPIPALPIPTPSPMPVVPARTRPYIMRDSTNPFDIPVDTEIVAGYINGLYAWPAVGWARFENSYQLTISISPFANAGSILDVENGDATPEQAPPWVKIRRAAGHDPWVYMNASTWPFVRAAFRNQKVPEPHYWVARWGPDHTIPLGAIALQYANPTLTGRHYDESIVSATWRSFQR